MGEWGRERNDRIMWVGERRGRGRGERGKGREGDWGEGGVRPCD